MGTAWCGSADRAGIVGTQFDHHNHALRAHAPHHARRHIVETQRLEAREATGQKQAKTETIAPAETEPSAVSSVIAMPGTGVEPVRPLRGSGF